MYSFLQLSLSARTLEIVIIADTPDDMNIASYLSPNEIPGLVDRILETEQSKKKKRDQSRKMVMYHEVSISALAEAGCQETSVKVPFQRKYSSRKPVVPSSLANTPCVDLGTDELLYHLNTLLGTSYESTQDSLSSLLQSCISANYDFGTAYSRLRPEWFSDLKTVEDTQRQLETEDLETRRQVLVDNRIRNAMPPRRVWDLYSNRVVLYCFILEEPWAVLHALVDEEDRVTVSTPINRYEWPVSIPKDANLDRIRIELLNLGAEYVWLDALCLRQKGGKREDLREIEWRTDRPTIRNVYRWSEVVVHYLNGLGRVSGRTDLKRRHLDVCDRSWFHYVWKEPEVNNHEIVAGYVPQDTEETAHPQGEVASSQKQLSDMDKGLQDVRQTHKESEALDGVHLYHILADMRKRVSTNPVDKVVGLGYPLRSWTLPAYYESESLEDAWTALVDTMQPWMRSSLLFLYPGAGLGYKKWRPTWMQIMTEPLPADAGCHGSIHHDDETGEDWCDGLCIEKMLIRGLDVGSAEGHDRWGELVVKDEDGIAHTFKVRVTHQCLIPEDVYTLLGDEAWSYWAVGRRLPGEKFEKVSVFEMADSEEIERLEDLGVAAQSRNVLV